MRERGGCEGGVAEAVAEGVGNIKGAKRQSANKTNNLPANGE